MNNESKCIHWFPIQKENHLEKSEGIGEESNTFIIYLRQVARLIPAIFIAMHIFSNRPYL